MKMSNLLAFMMITLFFVARAKADEFPKQASQYVCKIGTISFDVFSYRPKTFESSKGKILVVFHGVNRNADEYRDWAIPLADATGAVIIAPKFTKEDFPTSKYQQGNLLKDGKVTPSKDWTWALVPKLIEDARKKIGNDQIPFDLIGHSAGGQFLVRAAAFQDFGSSKIIAANAGTHLFPTREMNYPLGFGNLPDEISNDSFIRKYLAKPLVLFQGTADTEAGMNLDQSAAAMKQGPNRYERGKAMFLQGKALAAEKKWAFGWIFIEAGGIGHSGSKMFLHSNARLALAGQVP